LYNYTEFNILIDKFIIRRKYVTILFDLDGTVIDSTEAILESFSIALKEHQFNNVSESKVKSLIGYPLSIMFEQVGVKKEDVGNYILTYKNHYRSIANQKTLLLPRAKDAVSMAAEIATLGVVTTKTGRYSKDILNHLGIGHHFKTVIGFEDVKNPKPHPEPIEKAVADLKADKKRTWMIGDTHMDILSARSANVGYIAVSSGYESADSLLKHAEIVKNDIFDAIEYLKNNHR